MILEILRILFDLGLLVLIWMVQLVVYPSFLFYTDEGLIAWHSSYVQRISLVVIPLMFGQTFISGYQLYQEQTPYTIASVILVIVTWILTFTLFVPRHNAISNNTHTNKTLVELVSLNWYRTFVWTLIFVWTLLTLV